MPTLRPQTYAIPGYVREGYLAPWVPDVAYNVNHALMSFNLQRMPSYPEFIISFDQWRTESGGGAVYVGNPNAVRLYQTLSWPVICTADRDNWETFFHDIARAQSEPWRWYNPVQGNSLPVRFADADFPETPEVSLGYHKLSDLRLVVDNNYPGQAPSGSPNYNAAMGTALSIGSAVMQFPAPSRPNTGYGTKTGHALESTSAGAFTAWRTAKLRRREWKLSWGNLRYSHWIRLQSFFMTFVRGMRTTFTWYDTDGTARTVRLAEPTITVKQLGFDRYSCDLPLIETF